MDKYEFRRTKLLELINKMGRGGRVRVSEAIGKSPDYISRMLYPKDKAGHKGIGEDSVELIERAFPGWLGNIETSFLEARESNGEYKVFRNDWPFKTITHSEWNAIPEPVREMLERQIKAVLPLQETNVKLAAA